MSRTIRFGISMNKNLLDSFDRVIEKKNYPNRSEAIRDLIRNYIVEEDFKKENSDVIGSLTIIYDHHKRELPEQLTQLQHNVHNAVICSLHVHLNNHNCLENIIIKGKANNVKKIADKLISVKGVKHGKLTMTTTGKNII